MIPDGPVHDLTQLLLAANEVHFQSQELFGQFLLLLPVGLLKNLFHSRPFGKAQVLRNVVVENQPAQGCVNDCRKGVPVQFFGHPDLNRRMEPQLSVLVGHHGFVFVHEVVTFSRLSRLINGQIVGTQHHILGRDGHGLTVCRLQQVVGGKHEEPGLCLGFCRKGHMHRHLVAVEVGIEGGADQRMELDGSAVNQYRLKGLNGQTVQGRCPVQKDRMLLDYIFQSVPDAFVDLVDLLFGILNVGSLLGFHQPLHHKGLEQLQSHFSGQSALVDLQFRTDYDYRTAGIVHTLTQQVLTEPSLLPS